MRTRVSRMTRMTQPNLTVWYFSHSRGAMYTVKSCGFWHYLLSYNSEKNNLRTEINNEQRLSQEIMNLVNGVDAYLMFDHLKSLRFINHNKVNKFKFFLENIHNKQIVIFTACIYIELIEYSCEKFKDRNARNTKY